jgi:putative ABC transport system permease protein
VVWTLALRGVLRRPSETILLLLAVTAATTTLSLSFAFGSVTDFPWERTRALTAGPDLWIRADRGAEPVISPGTPGIREVGERRPLYQLNSLQTPGGTVTTLVEIRDDLSGRIDRPALVTGGWGRTPGDVVVERAFAEALDVEPGDEIRLAGRSLTVRGIAMTTCRAPYPSNAPGLLWATSHDERWLATQADRRMTAFGVLLTDPHRAVTLAASLTRDDDRVLAQPWQLTREWAISDQHRVRQILNVGAWALALLSMAGVAVLTGGRTADNRRRAGLLKAVGATPRLVGAILWTEHALIAVAAAALGAALGRAIAPLLVTSSVGLSDLTVTPSLTVTDAAIVLAMAVGVTSIATIPSAVHLARGSTTGALASTARPPRRSPLLIAVSARLPVPLLIGLRHTARAPRRMTLAVMNLSFTVGMVVAALCIRHLADQRDLRMATSDVFVPGAGNPFLDRLNQAVLAVMVALLAMAAMNTLLIGWATALEARRHNALLRALGSTTRQITAGLCGAQVLPAAAAGVLGIPVGLGIFAAATRLSGVDHVELVPPLGWLLPVPLVTVAVVTALMLWPARSTRRVGLAGVLAGE